MTRTGATAPRAPQAPVRSHRLAAPNPYDVLVALHRAGHDHPDRVWATVCDAVGLDAQAPALDMAQLAAGTAALAEQPGPAGLVGRAMAIRVAGYRALAAEPAQRAAPPWDWARESMEQLVRDRVPSPHRAAELLRLDPFDPGVRPALDRAASTAAHRLGAPIGIINIILDGAVHSAGSWGLQGWPRDAGGVPSEWSFCARYVREQEPYVLPDTRADVLQRHNPLVVQDGAGAYAGAPMVSSRGAVIGACCVISGSPRDFSGAEVAVLVEIAVSVVADLESTGRPGRLR